jgi:transposase
VRAIAPAWLKGNHQVRTAFELPVACTPPSRIERTWHAGARSGRNIRGGLTRDAWSSSTGSHKRRAIRRAIRTAGAKLLFLPAYSPDLNPIEQILAKLKAHLRKRAPRSVGATWRTIGQLLDAFTPRECANYFTNAGYASA